jgi:hypothetical protein
MEATWDELRQGSLSYLSKITRILRVIILVPTRERHCHSVKRCSGLDLRVCEKNLTQNITNKLN